MTMAAQSLNRILMVEHEQDIQAVAQLALEAIGGFSVRMCGSGKEAVEAGPAFVPDLILLDVMMPGMDGPSTLKALRELPETAVTPVIFTTAKVQPQEVVQYKALGVLDVIAKPFDPMTLSETVKTIWERHLVSGAETQLQALSLAFVSRLPEKLAQIDQAWEAAQRSWNLESASTLHRLAHSLHGTGATLGYTELSDAARTLEQLLVPLRSTAAQPSAEQREQIQILVGELNRAARAIATGTRPLTVGARDSLRGGRDRQLIFIAEIDPVVAPDLAPQLGHFGYSVRTFASLDDLGNEVAQRTPAAIIASATAIDAHMVGAQLTTIRQRCTPAPSVIFISDRGDLDTRLRAVRLGADAFFTGPVNTMALIDKLDALAASQPPEPYRILIVDGEPELADYYAATLRGSGMVVVAVSDPVRVLSELVDFRPDLILMDMYMPDCDGKELAAVIRQQEDYVSISIVFLSAETNLEMRFAAMRRGGDDFMTKPIQPDHLVSAVTSRVERLRALRAFMVRDSLTGLFNHTATKERLEVELSRARRQRTPMSFAIIDIDHFKSVNDTYGHPTGDRVLKGIARLLQQRLRATDVIGRYGGEEFAVVLVGTDGPTSVGVLDKIRAGLAQIRHKAGDTEFSVTFSGGIADVTEYPDAPALTDAADKALYEAKRAGRNRIVLAGRRRPSS